MVRSMVPGKQPLKRYFHVQLRISYKHTHSMSLHCDSLQYISLTLWSNLFSFLKLGYLSLNNDGQVMFAPLCAY